MDDSTTARVELYFSNASQLRERVRWLTDRGFTKFNLVNKSESDALVSHVRAIQGICDKVHVCVHYSLKYRKCPQSRRASDHAEKFKAFRKSLLDKCQPSAQLLLISGSRPPKSWTTIQALECLDLTEKVAVAFNPFFPKIEDREAEFERLAQKLQTRCVERVYLQFGCHVDLAKKGLEYIRKCDMNIPITASVFLPTAQLLSQQRFRPWNGVFLTEEDYLLNTETATNTTVQLLRLYSEYGVELLIEAPGLRTDTDLEVFNRLLLLRDEDGTQKKNPKRQKIKENWPSKPKANAKAGQNQKRSSLNSTTKPLTNNPAQKEKKPGTAIVLFGSHDVRVKSNFALDAALRQYEFVQPVFLWEPNQPEWGVVGALQVVLKDAIRNLQTNLSGHSRLKLLCRNTDDAIVEIFCIAQETNATAVFWNREMTPSGTAAEKRREEVLRSLNPSLHIESFQSFLVYDVSKVDLVSGFQGGHWGTLMPFLKACQKQLGEPPRAIPWDITKGLLKNSKPLENMPDGVKIKELDMAIMPLNTSWDKPIRERFPMTEQDAELRMERFFEYGLPKYERERSRADWEDATSQLSMHIRIGSISCHEVYWKIKDDKKMGWEEKKTFYRRLYWRDLAYYQLQCFPYMRDKSVRSHYDTVEWVIGAEGVRRLKAWQRGKTGYPMVDAGMRELYATGWMTQSVRMVVASFLTEYLRLHWVHGAKWFHDTLVDADQAINSMMWQNAGRSGLDQWNFVLSPENASQDPSGKYVRKWVPELSKLPNNVLHQPWKASHDDLRKAGVLLGVNYPRRIVSDLKSERQKTIDSVLDMRRKNQRLNNDRGYDLIRLPNGVETVVFTRKCYRINHRGDLIQEPPRTKRSKR